MRILYVTACMPYGHAETFIISEIDALMRSNDILVAPRSPGALGQHAAWLAPYTVREGLLSVGVLVRAALTFMRRPVPSILSLLQFLRTRRLRALLGNLAVYPKGLWLADVAEQWQADHIHCHWAGTTATMAMIASRVSGVPWSLTCHRSDIVSDNLLREKARHATFVRAIAAEGKRMLLDRKVKPDPKLVVLPMGVRVPALTSSAREQQPVVLCPADLLPVKGHRFLIDAWKILHGRGITAKLVLAGSGHLDAELRSRVEALGLQDFVTFAGTIRHENLLDFYRDAEVSAVVLASIDLGGGLHEGVPVALIEAMAYGVPVVATTTGGIPELIIPGTGILVPPENPEALANGLERLLRDPHFAHRMGKKGREWVMATRDVVHIAARLEMLFAAGHHSVPAPVEVVRAARA
jgi:glycosyltransferase involved in cell wall biosynthesis